MKIVFDFRGEKKKKLYGKKIMSSWWIL